MPGQDHSRKNNRSQDHGQHVESVLIPAMNRRHTAWDAEPKQENESEDDARRRANRADLAMVAVAAVTFTHSRYGTPRWFAVYRRAEGSFLAARGSKGPDCTAIAVDQAGVSTDSSLGRGPVRNCRSYSVS